MSGGAEPQTLRRRLDEGHALVGALVRMPCQELVEMLAVAGHDYVLVDCEHGSADLGELRSHVAAADSFGLPVLVRPGGDDPAFVLRALDLGVQGIVAPHVDSVEDASALVRASRYPPQGARGYATYSRAGHYGALSAEEHRRRADSVLVVAMIESLEAAQAASAITAVPGIDGYLIGTSDLAAARTTDDPPVEELVRTVHETASADAIRLQLAGSAVDARAALDDGARVVVHNLTRELMELFRALRV